MRMLLVFVPSDCLEDVQELMDRHEIHAYTEVPNLPGSGQSGRKLGTRAFPGTSSLLLAVLRPEEAELFRGALREYTDRAKCGNELRMFGIDAEMMI